MGKHTFGKFKEDISDMSIEELKTLQTQIKAEIFNHRGEKVIGAVRSIKVAKKMNAIIETKLTAMEVKA